MTRTACFVGVDIGTTTVKMSAADELGHELAVVRAATPWRLADGSTVLDCDDLSAVLTSLLGALADRLPGHQAVAVGFAGMAEAGYPLSADGLPLAPAIAWFDPGGTAELAGLLALGGRTFSATTGLRPTTRASAVKASWLRSRMSGQAVSWLNVPEWAAHWCGGRPVAEWSLAARSGFMDVTARNWWHDSLCWAGLDPSAMPELLPAGTPTGHARHGLPLIGGAVVTVAGHDHLAGAIGAGAVRPDDCFDSLGTGEALIRSRPATTDPVELAGAVAAGVERGPHIVPGRDHLFCVLGTGRLLRALLDARLGPGHTVSDVEALSHRAADLVINDAVEPVADALGVAARPTAALDPATVVAALAALPDADAWSVLVELTARRCRDAMRLLDGLGGPRATVIAAGGWYASAYVRAVRRRVLGPFRLPAAAESGTRGAARMALLACGAASDLTAWTDDWMEPTTS